MKDETEQTPEVDDAMKQLGEKLKRLGMALQDPDANVREISDLAHSVGLRFEFRLISKEE